ncbi:MAG: DUF4340 domain-containing protein [Spirochaetales bacterium]
MTRKRFLVRVAIVVGIAALALAVQLVARYALRGSDEPAESEIPRLLDIDDPELISSVEIETASRILSFERVPIDEGAYRERGVDIVLSEGRVPARTDRFEAYLEELCAMRRDSLVTNNPDRHRDLSVARGTAFSRGYDFRVTLTDRANTEHEALFGLSSDAPSVFVRKGGEDDVYRFEDTVSFYMDQGPQYWADFRLFAGQFPLESIESVRIDEYRDEEWKEMSRWDSAGSQQPRFEREGESGSPDYRDNERAVRRVLSLEADGFIQDGPQEPVWRITVTNEDRDRVRVHVGEDRSADAYPARIVSGQEHLTASERGPLALRAALFESVLSELE